MCKHRRNHRKSNGSSRNRGLPGKDVLEQRTAERRRKAAARDRQHARRHAKGGSSINRNSENDKAKIAANKHETFMKAWNNEPPEMSGALP